MPFSPGQESNTYVLYVLLYVFLYTYNIYVSHSIITNIRMILLKYFSCTLKNKTL